MIHNSVEKIQAKVLYDLEFGGAEAADDKLLYNCYCDIHSFHEILSGRKNIIVGEAGSGKTALFKMIASENNDICFDNPKEKEQITIPITEDLHYSLIKSDLLPNVTSSLTDPVLLYRYIWEIYILYRVSTKLMDRFESLPRELLDILTVIKSCFNPSSKKPSIFQLFSSTKKTIGAKVGASDIGVPIPEIFISVEPSGAKNDIKANIPIINADRTKQLINEFLEEKNCVIYILMDNLDDFVIMEEYETQKQVLEALLLCQRNYQPYNNLKLKLFIRSDLFSRINKSSLGGQKVHSKVIKLTWSPEDIRQLIARRVLYNLIHFLEKGSNKISVCISESELFIKEKSNRRKTKIDKIKQFFGIRIDTSDHYDTRAINLNDKFNRDIITFIFPSEIDHLNGSSDGEKQDFFRYLASHFNLGHGVTTPRIILMFLDGVLVEARKYLTWGRSSIADTKRITPLLAL